MEDMRGLSYFQPKKKLRPFLGSTQEIEDKACKRRNKRINISRNIDFGNE